MLQCEGRREWFHSSVKTLMLWEEEKRPVIVVDEQGQARPPALVISFWERVREIKKLCEAASEQLKQEIEARGAVPHPEKPGYALDVVLKNRRVINVARAQDLLLEYLGEAGLLELLTISTDKLKQAVMDMAEQGHKTEAWTLLEGRLRDADALAEEPYKQLELRRQVVETGRLPNG
jgi:hypothetical protein